MRTTVGLGDLGQLLDGCEANPFRVLGPHLVQSEGQQYLSVRAFVPSGQQVWLLDKAEGQQAQPMRKIHPSGIFEAICPYEQQPEPGQYLLKIADNRGNEVMVHDPYAFPPLLTDFDLHLLGEGRHFDSYRSLGAQVREVNGVTGVNFAVWAPNASAVSVVGDFNQWNGRAHPLRLRGGAGIWELFIPGLPTGTLYKYLIRNGNNQFEKCDPYGFAAEVPPKTASVVADLTKHQWQDQDWVQARSQSSFVDRPMSVYEVHLGSWRRPGDNPQRWLTYRELAHQLVDYVKDLGYTHIELLPVSEHPLSASWGYQPVGYFAATSRYGSPEDFMYFVDHCHQNEIGVILDWVPAHFPRDGHGLVQFDGTCLYEHADPRQGEHRDWGTLIFNYGRNEVCNFLISNALFWLDRYHIDGLRVDAVASMLYLDYSREEGEWIPNEYGGRENLQAIEFLKNLNIQTHAKFPGTLMVAEESTAWGGVSRPVYLGGLGFDLKWNMGWMNDTRVYFHKDPIHRQFHHNQLTFSLIYAFTENFVLPFSHDEVVHGKGSLLDQMPGDLWQRFANLRLLFTYQWTHPGKKLVFMGGEFGQWREWDFDNSLQWDLLQWDSHKGVQALMRDLNRLYRSTPALYEQEFDGAGFEWIDCNDGHNSTLSFIRRAKNPQDFVVVACNFTPVPREGFLLGVPEPGCYQEIFNSDSTYYAGSNMGNGLGATSQPIPVSGRQHSVRVVLPPLGAIILRKV